jgi:hypothetical protein
MLKYFVLFLLPLSLFASKILSYNIYDRTDRVDVMLTFDTPYTGRITQSKTPKQIIIKLQDASIESPKIKKLSSEFLKSISLTPANNETQIVASIPSRNVKLLASKTADGYGLRLRFTTSTVLKQQNGHKVENENNTFASSLPTKKDDEMSQSYYIVIAIMIIGILILFYLRKKIPQPNTKHTQATQNKSTNWLFQANKAQKTPAKASDTTAEVSIRFQKPLDEHNSVVMLDFGRQSYLVLMGNGNILLDKFQDDKPASQQEFETILQDRHDELEAFLHGKKDLNVDTGSQEALQSYKERAASLIYNEEN